MNDNLKNFLKEADETGLFTGGVPVVQEEYENTLKSCRLITRILIIICTVVILCDYFIF